MWTRNISNASLGTLSSWLGSSPGDLSVMDTWEQAPCRNPLAPPCSGIVNAWTLKKGVIEDPYLLAMCTPERCLVPCTHVWSVHVSIRSLFVVLASWTRGDLLTSVLSPRWERDLESEWSHRIRCGTSAIKWAPAGSARMGTNFFLGEHGHNWATHVHLFMVTCWGYHGHCDGHMLWWS